MQKSETINGTNVIYDYTYDDKGRLTQVSKDNSVVESYSYDANGNRLSAAVNGITTSASYTLDDQLEVYGDNTYRYDDDGYLIEKTTPDGTTTYTYSTLGELKEVVTPTQTISYEHNANNQRTAKLVNGTITEKYLWGDLTTLLAVYDKDDNLVQRFDYTDSRMPVSMNYNGSKYYLHYDQVGSLRAVSDSTNTIVKEIVYDTYGNIISDSNPEFKVPFGFAGGLYDSDTKLTRFGYRDYDPYTGKWTAKDPIDFAGGDTNLYGYVLGDPVNFVDPDGRLLFEIMYAHYTRNRFNDTPNYQEVGKKPWERQRKKESIFHQMREGNECNVKYVNPNGSEAVFNSNHELVTDPLNQGTYNYINNSTSRIGHGLVDVIPYFIFGNTPNDMFTTDRFEALFKK